MTSLLVLLASRVLSKASYTLGDFIRRSPRLAKIARCARCSDCDFRRSPRSAYKIVDIWHVRYRRPNSPAFAKCARSREFLRLFLRIASKANPSGWAILSHEFSKLPHRRDWRKKSPGVSASIGGENRLRSNLPRSAYKIARCVAGLRRDLNRTRTVPFIRLCLT